MVMEIKFRAIIPEKNAIIFFDILDFITPAQFSVKELLIPWIKEGNKPDRYVGLKDKNENEIYEGDILQYLSGDQKCGGYKELSGGNYVIEWNTYKYRLSRTSCDRHLQFTKGVGMIHQRPRDWEIIGNIYDNPELLEKTK